MKNKDSLLQSNLENLRQSIVDNRHEFRSMGPKLVSLLANRHLYLVALRGIGVMGWGYI